MAGRLAKSSRTSNSDGFKESTSEGPKKQCYFCQNCTVEFFVNLALENEHPTRACRLLTTHRGLLFLCIALMDAWTRIEADLNPQFYFFHFKLLSRKLNRACHMCPVAETFNAQMLATVLQREGGQIFTPVEGVLEGVDEQTKSRETTWFVCFWLT